MLEHYLRGFNPRPPGPADQAFLKELYASTRDDLRLALADARYISGLIDMQQRMQAIGYQNTFPDAAYLLLEQDGRLAGRLVVDCSAAEMRVVDLAFLAPARGCGLGSTVLLALQGCAADAGRRMALRVHHSNPRARRLYLRLGFQVQSRDEVSEQLAWDPPPSQGRAGRSC